MPNVHAGLPLLVALLLVVPAGACQSRSRPSDSSASSDAVRGDSVGDLTGAPRSVDSSVATRPAAPVPKSAADTSAQRRNDGSMTNPPIHRTNPRDDDIFRPDAPAAGSDQPSGDLLSQIRALAKPEGCATAGECRTLPVGRKACGGPRTYVVYCPKTTNESALKAKIAELDRADAEAAKHTMSDCAMVLPPKISVSGGACRSQ
jgi:hypothetical protein